MRKRFIIPVFIIILLAATNPSEDEYAAFAVNHKLGHYSNRITQAIGVPLLKSVTTTKDYFIATRFTTVIDQDHPIIVIGFLKKLFIKIS
jgi:hypothetical protein